MESKFKISPFSFVGLSVRKDITDSRTAEWMFINFVVVELAIKFVHSFVNSFKIGQKLRTVNGLQVCCMPALVVCSYRREKCLWACGGLGRSLRLIYREKYSYFSDIILSATQFVKTTQFGQAVGQTFQQKNQCYFLKSESDG